MEEEERGRVERGVKITRWNNLFMVPFIRSLLEGREEEEEECLLGGGGRVEEEEEIEVSFSFGTFGMGVWKITITGASRCNL